MTERPAPSLESWHGAGDLRRVTLQGRFVRLEPLSVDAHTGGLASIAEREDAPDRYRYLTEEPPASRTEIDQWMAWAEASEDPMFFAVVDEETGNVGGRQALMRVVPQHGAAEIGSILWGPGIARTRKATEAFFLMARHVFEDLGYRRLEWKCDNDNGPSKRAATRFGFTYEGCFRHHMVVKQRNRDTAWYSITDEDWPRVRASITGWLDDANFDPTGQQHHPLSAFLPSPAPVGR